MGNPILPAPPPLPNGYQVGSTVVPELPAERAFPLRNSDFLTLCDGTGGSERTSRDLCIGLWLGAATGLTSLICSVDFPSALTTIRVLLSFVFLLLIFGGSFAVGVVFAIRMRKEDTPYSRLKTMICNFFK